jgi:hypothetical protein
MDFTIPYGYPEIEDWILDFIYLHPKESYTTHTLREQLDAVLKAEPSHLKEYNRLMEKIAAEKTSPEEYDAQRHSKLEKVQRAVESLIETKLVTGKRDADDHGIVIFSDIFLTPKGERETITRDRARVEAKNDTKHKQVSKDKDTQKDEDKQAVENTDDNKQRAS